jgi:uncharacterized protein with HEPN domain
MSARRPDIIRLADMLRALERIDEILGEAAGHVSAATRTKFPEIGWKQMRGFTSFTKHEYWRVDPSLVWRAVEGAPGLRKALAAVERGLTDS